MTENSIFVRIPAYRDGELLPTLHNLFSNAAFPSNIRCSVCWQYLPGEDTPDPKFDSPYAGQVEFRNFPVQESLGVCWSRHIADQGYRGETFSLEIDSHMRFVRNWDQLLIAELGKCSQPDRAILSNNPPSYLPPMKLEDPPRAVIKRAGLFTKSGDMRTKPVGINRWPDEPLRGAFISGAFVFSRGRLIDEVPFDPLIQFDQEEISYSARIFTHGWNIYCPTQPILYHCYMNPKQETTQRPQYWKDNKKWGEMNRLSRSRFLHLIGVETSTDSATLKDIEQYGLGQARSLAEYGEFTGIDFPGQYVHRRGLQMEFVPEIEKYRNGPITIPEKEIERSNGRFDQNGIFQRPSQAPPQRPPEKITPVESKVQDSAIQLSENWSTTVSISVGAMLPFFVLPHLKGGQRCIDALAGKETLFFYATDQYPRFLERFLSSLKTHGKQNSDHQVCVILNGDTEKIRECVRKSDYNDMTLLDNNGAVGELFSAAEVCRKMPCVVCWTVSRNLQAMDRHAIIDPEIELAALFQALEITRQSQQPFHAPVLTLPNVLSARQCQDLISFWESGKQFDGKVGSAKTGYRPDMKVRRDCVITGELSKRVDFQLQRALLPEIRKVFGLNPMHREPYKIGCYPASEGGHFRQHRDNFAAELHHRRVALTLNLNSDFEGGGVVFPEYSDYEYKPEAGTALVFPCVLMHAASKVTSGNRFMMVTFLYSENDAKRRVEKLQGADTYPDRMVKLPLPDGLTLHNRENSFRQSD